MRRYTKEPPLQHTACTEWRARTAVCRVLHLGQDAGSLADGAPVELEVQTHDHAERERPVEAEIAARAREPSTGRDGWVPRRTRDRQPLAERATAVGNVIPSNSWSVVSSTGTTVTEVTSWNGSSSPFRSRPTEHAAGTLL